MLGKLGQLIALEEPQLQAVEESGGWNTEHSIMRGKLHSRIGRFKAALCKEAGGVRGQGSLTGSWAKDGGRDLPHAGVWEERGKNPVSRALLRFWDRVCAGPNDLCILGLDSLCTAPVF